MEKATRQQTKDHNIRLALKTIFRHPDISRADIARITGLTPTTVSEIVADLISQGLVNEVRLGASLGGKPPIQVSLVEDSRYLIGLDLRYDKFYGAVVNLRGKIRQVSEIPVRDVSEQSALKSVYEILDNLVQASPTPPVGIGIGTPGLVNTQDGVVVSAVNLDWKDFPLSRLLQERYGVPVRILNDSQAAALGEYSYGEDHQGDNSLIVINVRHGIGAGIIINGHLYQGDSGGAGEIGHVVVVREGGLPCRCGHMGCLETVASSRAIVQRAQMLAPFAAYSSLAKIPPDDVNLENLERAFVKEDALARTVILEAGRYIGLAISSMVGTLNIQNIVLTGDMTCFGAPWLNAIRETFSQTTLQRLVTGTKVEIGKLGEECVILGASAILLKDYTLLFKG